jgi:adenosylcobinamide-GDP ribazoletransferase
VSEPEKKPEPRTNPIWALVFATCQVAVIPFFFFTKGARARRQGSSVRERALSLAMTPLAASAFGLIAYAALLGLRRPWHGPLPMALVWLVAVLSRPALLDGVSDYGDAMWLIPRRTREVTLRILKDPNSGAMGVILLVSVMIGGLCALLALPDDRIFGTFYAVPALATWAGLVSIFRAPPAYEESHLAAPVRAFGPSTFLGSTLFVGVCAFYGLGPARAGIGGGIALVIAFWYRRRSRLRLGGMQGDVFNMVVESTGLALLLLQAAY